MPPLTPSFAARTAPGSAAAGRINRAMLCAGFSAFALLYCVQPLMPELGAAFVLTPAQSSWSLSITTLAMAVSLVLSGFLSERFGRKRVMSLSLVAAALLTVLAAAAQDFGQLLVLRALAGAALGGMPAVAMAYLAEEMEPGSLGLSMGIYIAGTAFGGTVGRVAASVLSEAASWRVALAVCGAAGLVAAWEFWRCLPAPRAARAAAPGPGQGACRVLADGIRLHLRDPGLRWLYLLAFLVMGVFVAAYNYISFRLLDAPFGLGQGMVGALSLFYLVGIFSAMWAGRLADRLGRRNVLWVMVAIMLAGLVLTLSDALPVLLAGLGLFTFGFFASHSVGSSWVGRRAAAPQALASALYLFFYYAGSSVLGSASGVLWSAAAWPGVVALLALALGGALAIALHMRALAPAAEPAPPRLAATSA